MRPATVCNATRRLFTLAIGTFDTAVPIMFTAPVGLSDLAPPIDADPADEPEDDDIDLDEVENEEVAP